MNRRLRHSWTKLGRTCPQATLFLVNDEERDQLRAALRRWLAAGGSYPNEPVPGFQADKVLDVW